MDKKDQAQLVADTIDKVTEALDNENLSAAEALGVLSFVNGLILHQGFAAMQQEEDKSED